MTETLTPLLSACRCCPRACGVNRLAGEIGYCGTAAEILVAHTGLHFGEEPPLSGTKGSGTIFFAGCNLRCVFCQNHQISQEFDRRECRAHDAASLASEMLRLQEAGAHNINLVSPSHVVCQAADAIREAKERGLRVPIVYNSNGYDSVDSLRRIRGLVDIYLPDLKYLSEEIAERYSDALDYVEIAPAAIREMWEQVGFLETDRRGIATHGLLVRHLVLPGRLENSRRCLRFLAELSREISVSILSQYSPRHRAADYPEIDRYPTVEEYREIAEFALQIGLSNAYVQEMESRDHYLPDFSRDRPFET
ncbi:MAG: radical SAM protein [Candidatus Eisenbacteria bacterium]|nr:radical SAM protein [Candidatus Eisenbacteria bacterium]